MKNIPTELIDYIFTLTGDLNICRYNNREFAYRQVAKTYGLDSQEKFSLLDIKDDEINRIIRFLQEKKNFDFFVAGGFATALFSRLMKYNRSYEYGDIDIYI